jgi:hypothetical protein
MGQAIGVAGAIVVAFVALVRLKRVDSPRYRLSDLLLPGLGLSEVAAYTAEP